MTTNDSTHTELLALDIGGTKIGWAILDASQDVPVVLESGSIPTNADAGGPDVARRIAELVSERSERPHLLRGVGVASAGVVNPATGDIVSATDTMPGWGGIKLGEIIREAAQVPVHILNDVHAHGLGEARLGAGRGHSLVLSLAIGTGIGGAIVRDGDVEFGAHHLGGHFGHIHHHFGAGVECTCGRTGHIEGFCSGFGLTNWYNMRKDSEVVRVVNGRDVANRAGAGDPLAIACMGESAYAVGEVLGSLANSIDPHVIVLSGSVTQAGDLWWDSVRDGYAASAMDAVAGIDLRPAELGNNAPLLGAVINFMQKEF